MRGLIHIVLLSLISLSFLAAQSIEEKRELRAMFDKSGNLWFKKYHGMLDDIHPMAMTLATNGTLWRGWYKMNDGSLKMSLEGSSDQNKLSLYELNPTQDYCAVFDLDMLGDDLSGMWRAVEGDQQFAVELSQKNIPANHCNQSKIQVYSTLLDNKAYQLSLTMEGKDIVSSKLSINNVAFDLELKCQNEDCSKLHADISEFGGSFKEVFFTRTAPDNIDLQLGKTESRAIALKLNQSLDFQCLRFANFTHKIDLVYPTIEAEVFNNWLISEFRNSIDLSTKKIDESDMDCEDRWSKHSFGWVDIHYFDEDIISGILVYQLADKEIPMTKSFIYDLKDDKKLSDQSLFDKKSNFQNILADKVSNFKTHMVQDDKKQLAPILDKLDYKHISLSEDGLILSADYSSIWGNKYIHIPYGDLQEDLHKSISKKFLKK